MSRKRVPLNQNECTADFRIGVPFEQNLQSVECSYKKTTTFSDEISIEVTALAFNGIKLKLGYVMKNAEGVTVCEASSCHCFLNTDGYPVRLKKEFPEFYSTLASLV